jgi:hypothetical protein
LVSSRVAVLDPLLGDGYPSRSTILVVGPPVVVTDEGLDITEDLSKYHSIDLESLKDEEELAGFERAVALLPASSET